MGITQSRRQFLTALSLAGAARLVGAPVALAAEGPLETTKVRFVKIPGICNAPQYVAEELLQAEGFTDISYVGRVAAGAPAVAAVVRGDADFTVTYAAPLAIGIDGGAPVTVISGVHIGCFELFGNESIRSIADLKGKSVGVQALGSSQHVFSAAMVAYVGLDPAKDIHWVINPSVKPTELYEKGQIDAFLGFPPEPQDLRTRHIGRVIVTALLTDHGRSISAACSPAAAIMLANIRSLPSGCCAPSLRLTTFAALSRTGRRGGSSIAGSLPAMTMPCKR